MLPFLQQVARHYIEAQGLEDYCFVFPNRRSGQFFTYYLQRELAALDPHPHLLPRVTAINDLLTELTHATVATDIEMIFALYDAYCAVMGDRAQQFDKFIYWAQLIISDFNDIDRSMADAREIYTNLDDLNSLSSNYLSPEVQAAVEKVFGPSLFTSFFDTSAEADLWQRRGSSQPSTADGPVRQEFISLWNALHAIYQEYHKALESRGVVSPGHLLRQAAEHDIDLARYTRLVFVGFGILSIAEVKLFDRFNSAGKADFWWDNAGVQALLDQAPHDPGALLIDGYSKRFVAKPLHPLDGKGPDITVVSVASNVGQAKQAFDLIQTMREDENDVSGIETAIVLPDEGLLVPLLHSVHNVEALNITLGYPLRSSSIVSLMHIVARMHHQASKERGEWTYYREDVYDILSHPLIKGYFTSDALNILAQLSLHNRFRIPAREFEALPFSDLFAPAMDSDEPGGAQQSQSRYLGHLLAFCNLLMEKMDVQIESRETDDDEDDAQAVIPLQQAFLDMYINVLNQLKHSLATCRQHLESTTVFYLIDRLMASVIVPFTGEPLKGMQVMGLLETRSLDFKHVLILSMNERVFPRRRGITSFIPNYIRRAHGMSTIEQQEAIVAYNFYRLFNRASKVTLVYDSSAQKLGSAEPSRFIAQLEKIYGKTLRHVEMSPVVRTSSPIEIEVPNTGYEDLRRRYLAQHPHAAEWFLSASAINKYIYCPLSFYMHYIQGMSDDNDVSDFMDYGTFGTIVHDTLKDCYDCPQSQARGGLIDRPYIEWFKKHRLDAVVTANIKKTYLHVSEQDLPTDNQPLRGEAFMLVDTIKSYVNFVLDYDLALIDKEGPFTILECERRHELPSMQIGGATVNFTFTPDRIDRLNDGTVRIVDYKTGRDGTSFASIDDLFDRAKNRLYGEKGRRKAILQLFLYCYAYLLENKDVESVQPIIYKIGAMKDSGVKTRPAANNKAPLEQYAFSMDNETAREFMAKMGETINDIYDKGFGQAEEGTPPCSHCRFIDFCRRMPPQTSF